MHQTEAGQLVTCGDRGAEIVSARERSYVYSDEGEICLTCAIRRGGRYDELHDRWDVAPAVQDLLEREREAESALVR